MGHDPPLCVVLKNLGGVGYGVGYKRLLPENVCSVGD